MAFATGHARAARPIGTYARDRPIGRGTHAASGRDHCCAQWQLSGGGYWKLQIKMRETGCILLWCIIPKCASPARPCHPSHTIARRQKRSSQVCVNRCKRPCRGLISGPVPGLHVSCTNSVLHHSSSTSSIGAGVLLSCLLLGRLCREELMLLAESSGAMSK